MFKKYINTLVVYSSNDEKKSSSLLVATLISIPYISMFIWFMIKTYCPFYIPFFNLFLLIFIVGFLAEVLYLLFIYLFRSKYSNLDIVKRRAWLTSYTNLKKLNKEQKCKWLIDIDTAHNKETFTFQLLGGNKDNDATAQVILEGLTAYLKSNTNLFWTLDSSLVTDSEIVLVYRHSVLTRKTFMDFVEE